MNAVVNQEAEVPGRLSRLLQLLQSDPNNLSLLADTAEAAVDDRDTETAKTLLGRYAAIAPLPARETNLAGLVALQERQFGSAADAFGALLDQGVDNPGVRFNLAWAKANLKDFAGANDALDDETAQALPQAATLRIQLLHQLGLLDEAAEAAHRYMELYPGHRGLMAAISVLAIDVEDEALAAQCAAIAGDHPDALTTRGTLALGGERATEAVDLFERALADDANLPRAWIGLGLAKLVTGQAAAAAPDIDRGAEMFGDHLGSWIAAGWAYFINGDRETAQSRFETALALDDNFAETHGSLAVLDVLAGRIPEARRRLEIALRLDRQCYSAALASVLIAAGEGNAETARRIFEHAISTPIDGSGRTIAASLTRMGLGLQ